MGDNKSVTIQGNNSGIIITGNKSTIYIDKEKLLNKESVTNTFKLYYQNHFKTISLLIEDDKKPIDDIYVNLAIIREEKEENIKDKSKLLDRDKIINSYEEIYKPKEPIAIEELIAKSSRHNSAKALIYGKAGIGKTTFCKYIAYRWAKGELYSEFENIVYIALREWRDDGLESIIKKIYFEERYKDEAIEIDQSKTLFLFDGYDELLETSLLHSAIKKYNLQNYIITSRPYGYRKSDFDTNEVFETIGFTDENVTAYIDKFFEEQNHKINLKNFLKQNINIKHIAYIPLMLEMICSLWREKANSYEIFASMNISQFYEEVIDNLLSTYARKKGYKEVYKRKYKKEIITYLGSIAFEAWRTKTIVIDGQILEKSLKSIKTEDEDEFLEKSILYAGLLQSDNKSINPWKNSYQFSHLTFQEYFTASYVARLDENFVIDFTRENAMKNEYQIFFIFLSEKIHDKEYFLEFIKIFLSHISNEKMELDDRIKYFEFFSQFTIKNISVENYIMEAYIDILRSNSHTVYHSGWMGYGATTIINDIVKVIASFERQDNLYITYLKKIVEIDYDLDENIDTDGRHYSILNKLVLFKQSSFLIKTFIEQNKNITFFGYLTNLGKEFIGLEKEFKFVDLLDYFLKRNDFDNILLMLIKSNNLKLVIEFFKVIFSLNYRLVESRNLCIKVMSKDTEFTNSIKSLLKFNKLNDSIKMNFSIVLAKKNIYDKFIIKNLIYYWNSIYTEKTEKEELYNLIIAITGEKPRKKIIYKDYIKKFYFLYRRILSIIIVLIPIIILFTIFSVYVKIEEQIIQLKTKNEKKFKS
jgi:hypothetical protein